MLTKKIKTKSGFSLVEALLAVSVFVFILTAITGALIYGRESFFIAGTKARAIFLAEEGLEAVRNIRDNNFSNLSDGSYGLAIVSGEWRFSGSSDTAGVFTRQIVISTVDADRKMVTSNVTWQQNSQRQGLISLPAYMANWNRVSGPPSTPSCGVYCQDAGYTAGTCRANQVQCGINGEIYDSGGDVYCTGGANLDTCCCLP